MQYVEDIENPGCNNGNYPMFVATALNGAKVSGIVCRCRGGCSNTDTLAQITGRWYIVPDIG